MMQILAFEQQSRLNRTNREQWGMQRQTMLTESYLQPKTPLIAILTRKNP
jgi:hypothetical protein